MHEGHQWTPGTRAEWEKRAAEELEGRALATLRVATPSGVSVEPLYALDTEARVAPLPEHLRPVGGWLPAEDVDESAEPHAFARLAASEGVRVLRTRATSAAVVKRLADGLAAGAGAAAGGDVVLCGETLPVGEVAALRGVAGRVHGGFDPHRGAFRGAALLGGATAQHESAFVAACRAAGLDGQGAGRPLEIDATLVREAGGDAVLELAYVLAAFVERVRSAAAAGREPRDFLPACAVRVALCRDLFEEVAKLRALRLVVARVENALVPGASTRLLVHAQSARRELADVDEPTNALRTTAHAVAAALGGADTIALAPFELGSRRGERLARTTHAVLEHEAALGRVDDPTGGAWYVEHLTDALARAAWREFQGIEAAGGLVRWIESGALATRIDAARAALATRIAAGEHVLVGVNRYQLAPDASRRAQSPAPLARGANGWPKLDLFVESAFTGAVNSGGGA
jgi:methylmalonyl-CoA mutase